MPNKEICLKCWGERYDKELAGDYKPYVLATKEDFLRNVSEKIEFYKKFVCHLWKKSGTCFISLNPKLRHNMDHGIYAFVCSSKSEKCPYILEHLISNQDLKDAE